MWREFIKQWADVEFAEPANEFSIEGCGEALGVDLPSDLAALLRESNGVHHDGRDLVFSTNKIVQDNLLFRGHAKFGELYMPFEPLLFFSEDGGGDKFAFVSRDRPDNVFHWDHETDSRTMIAPNLARYLEWEFTDRLRLP